MMSNAEMVLEDWRRWLYVDGFLSAQREGHPCLIAVLSGELCYWLDGELWNRTGRPGGRRLPDVECSGRAYDPSEAVRQMSALRSSVLLDGPYPDVPLETQLAVTVLANYVRHVAMGDGPVHGDGPCEFEE